MKKEAALTAKGLGSNMCPLRKYTVLEIIVPTSTFATQSGEMMGIFQEFLTLRHNFKAVPPENVAAMRAYLDEERRKGKAGAIKFNQFYNVGVILSRASEPVTMGMFSHLLAVPLSTATRIADWMVQHGYVQRVRDGRDRRVVRLELTDEGRQLHDTINHFVCARVEWLMHELSPAERESMLTLMHRLVEIFQQYDSDAE